MFVRDKYSLGVVPHRQQPLPMNGRWTSRVADNDFFADPRAIGRFVDFHADLDTVRVSCAGTLVGALPTVLVEPPDDHRPAHVLTAAGLRTAFQARITAMSGPPPKPATGAVPGIKGSFSEGW